MKGCEKLVKLDTLGHKEYLSGCEIEASLFLLLDFLGGFVIIQNFTMQLYKDYFSVLYV